MTVWDVDDARVDELGEKVGALLVSHCYRRRGAARLAVQPVRDGPRPPPREVERLALRSLLADACRGSDIPYSSRILKKTGLRLPAE